MSETTSALAERVQKTAVRPAAAGAEDEERPRSVMGWMNARSTQLELAKALPQGMNAMRFHRILQTEIRKNPLLLEADLASFALGALNLAQLGLEPGPLGLAYLTGPFKNSRTGKKEVVPIIGYKGLQQLAFNAGEVELIDAVAVHEGEPFRIVRGTDPHIEHEELPECAGNPVVAYYALAIPKGGGRGVFEVMWPQDIEAIKKRSRAAARTDSPWSTDYDAMALKTVLRRLLNRGKVKLSAQVAAAVAEEEARELGFDAHLFEVGPMVIDAQAEPIADAGDAPQTDRPAAAGEEPKAETQDA